ncbi:NAD(P)/FAD-dependent oxidoreductase [Thalassotalea sp. ND16A]|uniref:NAD(P)/FAD-dependent oxidoreductase n=1 Tax=Thalassotalea sp. ND16A TaxID=1535422 RepID=UPI00051A7715|nr:FAD-dependent oxidoreductase [Thalassotalea sp. ND16A]KGJ98690.1 D-amino-acid dehydrogenase [Thalassotalea sp. ND16A]
MNKQTTNKTETVNHNKHFAIVGAGIVGICCGLELQELGYRVTFFDDQGFANGCSHGNAGHFATEQVFPLADPAILPQIPKMLLDPLGPIVLKPGYMLKALPWLTKFISNMRSKPFQHNHQALQSLNKDAIEYYRPLLAKANASHLLTTRGSLLVYENTPLSMIEKDLNKYLAGGVQVELLDKKQLVELEPTLSDRVNYALFFPDVAHTCDPYELCLALANSAMANNATLIKEKVTGISEAKQKVNIKTAQFCHQFDGVVIATGAWSKSILKPLNLKLPMEVERGYHYMLSNNHSLTRPVASAERKFIMTPMSKGLRLAGTVEFAGIKAKENYKHADKMLQHSYALLSKSTAEPSKNKEDRWMGLRPSLPDSLPVLDKSPLHENVYLALGHQHLGLTWGAKTAKLMAQLISEQSTSIDLKPFSISRFQ